MIDTQRRFAISRAGMQWDWRLGEPRVGQTPPGGTVVVGGAALVDDPNYPRTLGFVESEQHPMLQIGVCTRILFAQPGSCMAVGHAVPFSYDFSSFFPSVQQH